MEVDRHIQRYMFACGYMFAPLQKRIPLAFIKEGIIKAAIDFMQHIDNLEEEDKICVLAEMKVMETYEYEVVDDFVRAE